jgi:hypothetical protein
MAEGIEIVIDPKKLIVHGIYIVIIIVLTILLITHWNGGGKAADKEKVKETTTPTTGINQTNQTVNTTTQPANTCQNSLKESDETDVDCGGSKCAPCAENKLCIVDKDCATGLFCYQGIRCKKPSCTDGVKNQDETNIDCGGTCTSANGAYYYNGRCNLVQQPSGKFTITLSASVGESEVTQSAILKSLTMVLDNGLSDSLLLKANIYAQDPDGDYVSVDFNDNPVAITSVSLDSIDPNTKLTKTVSLVNNTRSTLAGIKSTDAFKILVEFTDSSGEVKYRQTWTNS